MAVNIQYRVSYLTQVTVSNPNREAESQVIETARVGASRACEEATLVSEEVALANACADKAIAETTELKRQFENLHKQLFAWQSGQAYTSIAPSSGHPRGHYDDDSDVQSVDLEEMSEG
ncbi:unnamed protein product [Vicia faba]|uniref:Uncharacterized protein n=1 Tax=Vicia faba TaxID=3906 RepID=A0AAV1B834_VICFA|nr:unnamed protein product [Vicia faba]